MLYLRQSKDAGLTGLAVDRQRTGCRRLAGERGWTVVEEGIDNDTSASTGRNRPGYQRALQLAEAGDIEVIIAWHVDRLTRRVAELESLIELCEHTGVRVATVSGDLDLTTDAGRLVGRILGAVAGGEVERKSARQKLANQQRAETGCAPARRAFGHNLDGNPHPAEAPVLRDVCAQVVAGLSINSATKWLSSYGHTTTAGKSVGPQQRREDAGQPPQRRAPHLPGEDRGRWDVGTGGQRGALPGHRRRDRGPLLPPGHPARPAAPGAATPTAATAALQRTVLDTLAQVTVERGTPGRARDKPIGVNISWRSQQMARVGPADRVVRGVR